MTKTFSEAVAAMFLLATLCTILLSDPLHSANAFVPTSVVKGHSNLWFRNNVIISSSRKFSTAVTETEAVSQKSKKSKTSLKRTKNKSIGKKKKPNTMKANGQKGTAPKSNNKKTKKITKTKKSTNTKKNRIRKPLTDLTLGSKISGRVVDICSFGAFIETQYAVKGSHYGCALLHISHIKDEKVQDISKELKVGQRLRDLRVINIDYDKAEVALSLRTPRPKRTLLSQIMEGDELEGRVARIASYGAFVDVGCTVDALVHISRISQDKVNNINDYLKIGDIVPVRIIDVNGGKKTLAASMLPADADRYLNRRREMKERQRRRQQAWSEAEPGNSEVGFFEDAIKELEDAFQEDYGGWSSKDQ